MQKIGQDTYTILKHSCILTLSSRCGFKFKQQDEQWYSSSLVMIFVAIMQEAFDSGYVLEGIILLTKFGL